MTEAVTGVEIARMLGIDLHTQKPVLCMYCGESVPFPEHIFVYDRNDQLWWKSRLELCPSCYEGED